MLRDTRIGCISTRRVLPGERLGDETTGSGDEGGSGTPEYVISFLSALWGRLLFFFLSFSFVHFFCLTYFFPLLGGSKEEEQ